MDDAIKLISVELYTETKEVPVMNIYGKPLAMPHILETGCYECCGTCKHYRGNKCVFYIGGSKPETWIKCERQINDFHFYEFVCDFYRRRNSGAFRRKLRKYKKKIRETEARKNE